MDTKPRLRGCPIDQFSGCLACGAREISGAISAERAARLKLEEHHVRPDPSDDRVNLAVEMTGARTCTRRPGFAASEAETYDERHDVHSGWQTLLQRKVTPKLAFKTVQDAARRDGSCDVAE